MQGLRWREQVGCSSVTSIATKRVDGSRRSSRQIRRKTSAAGCAVADPTTRRSADLGGRPALFAKIFPLPFLPKSPAYSLPSRPTEGRLAIVTDAGRDAMDVRAHLTSAPSCGRQSRVVLTPRRWCQVGERDFTDDGGKQARSPGRARNKLLKPLRGECRATRRDRGD
jgi:hypothetical protein